MENYCDIHKIKLTPSFDSTNMFCFECETTGVSRPATIGGGFNVTAAPIGPVISFKYYAVTDQEQPDDSPQFQRLFKNRSKARKEFDTRLNSFYPLDQFIITEVESATECIHWFSSGMSRDTYAVWSRGTKLKDTNGNHVVILRRIRSTIKSQTKLQPKVGAGLKSISPLPTHAAPTTKPAQPKKTSKPKKKKMSPLPIQAPPKSKKKKKTKLKVKSPKVVKLTLSKKKNPIK